MRKLLLILLLLPCLLRGQSIVVSTDTNVVCSGSAVAFSASALGAASPHYRWMVNHLVEGTDSSGFVTTSLLNNDTVACALTNAPGDTVFATSNSIVMTVQHMPNAGVILGSDNVCLNGTTTLTDSVVGGKWSATSDNAVVVAGVVTGQKVLHTIEGQAVRSLDTITYSLTNACGADSTQWAISIIPIPNAGFYLGTAPIAPYYVTSTCAGNSVPINGENGYEGTIYSKYGFTHSDSWYLDAISAGNDILIGVSTNFCGSDTFTMSFTVVNSSYNPGILTLPKTKLCVGDTIYVAALGNTAKQIYWHTKNGNASIDVVSGRLIAKHPGVEIITVLTTNACTQYNNQSDSITIEPPLAINQTQAICINEMTHLIDSTPNGTWRVNDVTGCNLDATSGAIVGKKAGTYRVSYSMEAGCSVSTTIDVKPLPKPVNVSQTTICAGANFQLESNEKVSWTTLNPWVANINSIGGNGKTAHEGVALIKYTLANGCFDSTHFYVTDCSEEINIFPDPAKNELYIEVDTLHFTEYSIVDISGRSMGSGKLSIVLTRIDTELWRPGMYIINIQGVNGLSFYGKVVKE